MHVVIRKASVIYILSLMILTIFSQNLVTNEWNFMKLILDINDPSVAMHVKFHQDVSSYRGCIAL